MTRYVTFPDAPGSPRLQVEVASTAAARARGLKQRPWLHPDHGMLFSWSEARVQTVWMRDTLIPLDVIFVDLYGRITGILEDVPPLSDRPHTSPGLVLYAIEVNAGWCKRNGVAAGQRIL